MKENKYPRCLVLTCVMYAIILMSASTGCNKNQNTYVSYHRGVDASQHFVANQQMMTQLFNTYFKSLTDSTLLNTGTSFIDGGKVHFFKDDYERIFIEYPSYGANDGYGHWRTGTYEARTDESFLKEGAHIEFKFNDFSWDKDTLVVDTLTMDNMGKLDGVNDHFYVWSNDIFKYYELSEDSSSFMMDEYIQRIKDPKEKYTSQEDKFRIWGSFYGTTVFQVRYESVMVEDSSLLNAFSCNWLKEGPSVVMAENFGYLSNVYFSVADSCENQYLVEINGNPFPFPIDE